MKVVFLGNHTVGVRVLQAMKDLADIIGVVTHPPDPEDGVRYESVFEFARQHQWKTIRGRGRDPETLQFIASLKPDLLWITDYRYLIPRELLTLSPLGTVNLHPSLLPAYRGRASINWAILKGETQLGLTGHFVDEGMDTGDIIEQMSYNITEDQDVGDCLNILYPMYATITQRILSYFRRGTVPITPQDESRATAFPGRKPEDGRIDWSQPARQVLNLVRAVASPYPGAFTTLQGQKLTLWRARVISETMAGSPGSVFDCRRGEIFIQCGMGALSVAKFDWQGPTNLLQIGACLGT